MTAPDSFNDPENLPPTELGGPPKHTAPRATVGGGRSLTDVVLGLEDSAVGTVVPTGFDPLDKVLDGGLRSRDLTLIGGVPGVGKTVVTLQWARNSAMAGFNTAYVCYEHDQEALASRLLAVEVGEMKATEENIRFKINISAKTLDFSNFMTDNQWWHRSLFPTRSWRSAARKNSASAPRGITTHRIFQTLWQNPP